jgi:hypothetical protein
LAFDAAALAARAIAIPASMQAFLSFFFKLILQKKCMDRKMPT